MDERTPAPGESLSSPTGFPPGSAGFGQQRFEGQSSWSGEETSHGRQDVRRMGSAARRRLVSEADRRKSGIADRIDQFANSLDGGNLSGPEARLIGSASRMAHGASSMLRERSSEELLQNLEQGFRDRPGAFLAGCLALGFIGGRLLRG